MTESPAVPENVKLAFEFGGHSNFLRTLKVGDIVESKLSKNSLHPIAYRIGIKIQTRKVEGKTWVKRIS